MACYFVFNLLNPRTQILFIRHAEVPGNDPQSSDYRYTGSRTNDSLTANGVEQAKACAECIRQLWNANKIGTVEAVYASDLKRAKETGAIIADAFHKKLCTRPSLREIDWGVADGQLVSEMDKRHQDDVNFIHAKIPDRKMRWDYLPIFKDAEKFNTLLKRGMKELSAISREHLGGTVIVVGHGRMLKTLIAAATNSEVNIPYPKNCGIVEFSKVPLRRLQFEGILDARPQKQKMITSKL